MSAGRRRTTRGARRRVRTGSALFLCAFSTAGLLLTGLLAPLAGGLSPWLGAAAQLLFFAGPACLGLRVIDGDQTHLLARRPLSGAQALWLAASGVLLVCPMTLLGDVLIAALGLFGVRSGGAQAAMDGAMLLPVLLQSGVLAPLCEELFFRGYLLGVLSRYGQGPAAVATALLFSLSHGVTVAMPAYAVLGLLLAALVLRTGSLLAPVLVHMAYNMALVLLSAGGLSALFEGLTMPGCLVRLCGCAALCVTLGNAVRARGVRGGAPETGLTWREGLLLCAAPLCAAAAQLLAGVMGG